MGNLVPSTKPNADDRCHPDFGACLEPAPAALAGRQIQQMAADLDEWNASCGRSP